MFHFATLKEKILMKRAIFMATILLSSMGLVNITLADESPDSIFAPLFKSHFGDDHFGATVGYKAWFNTWDLPIDRPFDGQVIIVDSGTEISHIPIVSLRYKNFFVSGSYFTKTDYDFDKMYDEQGYYSSDLDSYGNVMFIEENISAERSEWDITTGYYVNPNLAITFGYKNIERVYHHSYSHSFVQSSGEIVTYTGQHQDNMKTKGLTLGLTSSVPLGRGFGVYSNFAYGRLASTWGMDNLSIPYYLGEMGLTYSLRFKNHTIDAASFHAGYRFQRIDFEGTIFKEQTVKDRTDGFVFGVNFNF